MSITNHPFRMMVGKEIADQVRSWRFLKLLGIITLTCMGWLYTVLTLSGRTLGQLTMEQLHGAIPSPLPLRQSLLVAWPQLTGLIAATVVCFAVSYVSFMRKEVCFRQKGRNAAPGGCFPVSGAARNSRIGGVR